MRVYLEGARRLRGPMKTFLIKAVRAIHHQAITLEVEPCGSRDSAISRCARDAGALLLIDSEGEDLQQLTNRIAARAGATQRAFFMVQLMEAWFLADREALVAYYGRGFNAGALSRNPNVESVLKEDVEDGLRNATRRSRKGAYHKGEHARDLLAQISPTAVYSACPNFARLIDHLREHALSRSS